MLTSIDIKKEQQALSNNRSNHNLQRVAMLQHSHTEKVHEPQGSLWRSTSKARRLSGAFKGCFANYCTQPGCCWTTAAITGPNSGGDNQRWPPSKSAPVCLSVIAWIKNSEHQCAFPSSTARFNDKDAVKTQSSKRTFAHHCPPARHPPPPLSNNNHTCSCDKVCTLQYPLENSFIRTEIWARYPGGRVGGGVSTGENMNQIVLLYAQGGWATQSQKSRQGFHHLPTACKKHIVVFQRTLNSRKNVPCWTRIHH